MSTDHINQLLSSYEIERHDDASALALAFTMATASFTYMIAASLYVNKNCTASGCINPPWIQVAAPAVPVAVLGFFVLTTASTRMRSLHLQELEAKLEALQSTGDDGILRAPSFHTRSGVIWRPDGLWRLDRFSDISHIVFAAVNSVVYGVVLLGTVGFMVSVLWGSPWTVVKQVTACIYGICVLIEMGGFVAALTDKRFRNP